jgi:peptidoglycan/LPS O-acetylase OafA/YrhL
MLCLPVLLFGTIFLALFGAQMIQHDSQRALTTVVVGTILVSLLTAICNYASSKAAWGTVVVLVAAMILYLLIQGGVINTPSTVKTTTTAAVTSTVPTFCPCASQESKCDC